MAFNKVILIGNLCSDPELKQTQGGLSVCSFNIAVNRRFKVEGQQDVDFISIVAWRQQAEFVTRYFHKGQPILICGQIQSRNYTDKQGNKRTAVEVVADEVSFVGNKESGEGGQSRTYDAANDKCYMPTGYTQNSQNFEEIPSDESLPF